MATDSGLSVRSISALALVAIALAVGSCGKSAPLPFDGGRSVRLPSLRAGEPLSAEEQSELIDALLEVYGGADRLPGLGFFRRDDVFLAGGGSIMTNWHVRETWYRPGRVRVNNDYRDGLEQRVLYEETTYLATQGAPELKEAVGDRYQNVLLDYFQHSVPGRLREPGVQVTSLAPQRFEGRDLAVLNVDFGSKPLLELWVDPVGPAIRVLQAVLPLTGDLVAGRSTATTRLVVKEWRRVDGVLVPANQALFVGRADEPLERFGQVDLVEVEVSDDPERDFDDTLFRPAQE